MRHVKATPSGCGLLEMPGVSQVAEGDKTLVKTEGKTISHSARSRASNTDQPDEFIAESIQANT